MRKTLVSRGSAIAFTSILGLTALQCSNGASTLGDQGGSNGAGASGSTSVTTAGHGGSTVSSSSQASVSASQAIASQASSSSQGSTSTAGAGGSSQASSTNATQASSSSSSSATQASSSTGAGGATTGSGGAGGSGGTMSGFQPYVCPAGPFNGITIPNGSAATQIAGAPPSDTFNNTLYDFTNVEGPVWIGDALYFSEMVNGPNPPKARILKIDASDKVSYFFPAMGATGDSGSNGLAVDRAGNLVSANHGVGGIVAFDVSTQMKIDPPLIDVYNGKRFNSPNDLAIRSDGTIYFTDPIFQAASPPPQGSNGAVYMLPPKGTTATMITGLTNNPNGITLSLDEKTLYVGYGGGVNKYSVNADGTVGATATPVDPADLNNNATDGMAIDCAGNLYVVRVNQKDIIVVGPANTQIGKITITNSGQLTNCAFGGTDHKTLYVTAQGGSGRGVYKVPMPLPGMPY